MTRRGVASFLPRGLIIGLSAFLLLTAHRAELWAAPAAGDRFAQGEKLYAAGQFKAALEAFSAAQQLAPHRATLFNIARCHENLGELDRAVRFYRQTLKLTTSADQRADLAGRIARIQARPVKVFVTSEPVGASVTVDTGQPRSARPTPAIFDMRPGWHLLVLRHPTRRVTTRRVQVQIGRPATVKVALDPLPASKPCPPPLPCQKSCEPPKLVAFEDTLLHVSVGASSLVAQGWGAVTGPELHLGATIGRLFVGGHFFGVPLTRETVGSTDPGSAFLLRGAVEAGWVFPFRRSYLQASAAFGGYLDRISNFAESASSPVSGKEASGLTWSLGGSYQVMFARWLSLALTLRLGMMHGTRIENANALDDDRHFLFVTTSYGIVFHI